MSGPIRLVLALLAPLLAGTAVGGYFWYDTRDQSTVDPAPTSPVQRVGASLRLSTALAESYGIRAAPAVAVRWDEPAVVYGRVVVNPQASVEVRAPFAGVLKPAAGKPWPGLGTHVVAQEPLAVLETRLTPVERIDLRAKSAEAEAKSKGAAASVTIQEERVKQLEELKRTGAAAQREIQAAQLLLLEARTQLNATRDQWHVYREALAAPEGQSVSVPLLAPLTGEVADLMAQPGLTVEPGYVLMKLVDFCRVLVRLDFPVTTAQAAPPHDVSVSVAGVDAHPSPVPAVYTGSAPQVDPASQRASLLYALEAPSGTAWRPGLYVRAAFPDPSVKPRPAVAVPASALLYHQGRTLLYIQISRDRFERHEVEVLGRDGDTAVLGSGVRAGESVVCAGAQILLSAEFRRDTDDDD